MTPERAIWTLSLTQQPVTFPNLLGLHESPYVAAQARRIYIERSGELHRMESKVY